MAKPKQKSGLGRGLDSLFGQSDVASSYTSPKQQPESAAPVAPEKTQEAQKPVAEPTPSRKIEHGSDIYISENAVETAKVVERQARPSRNAAPATRTSQSVMVASGQTVEPTMEAKPAESGEDKAVEPVSGDVIEVFLLDVHPNPDQPRTHFKKEEIEELASSIAQDGLLQPILVRPGEEGYQIIAGERRWQACRSLGLEKVPVRLWDADEDKALELALIENIQRSDLNPIEEAYGYKRLMERKGMTQSEVAQTVSKGRSTIANALRLLELPEEAQRLLFEEKITAGHARAILSIPSAEGRMTLTRKLEEEKLSVREAESLARLIAGREKAHDADTPKRTPAPASFKKAARGLTKLLSAPVRVKTVKGKNKIEIQFKDEEELQRIMDAISHTESAE
ncbi:MAG: ParB/RepB/Spo0J family partition protein [Coriobacteriia bacterium]|nr:ParB/RepB/Spo0J family partition protein [Coriobacteriia bacterium]